MQFNRLSPCLEHRFLSPVIIAGPAAAYMAALLIGKENMPEIPTEVPRLPTIIRHWRTLWLALVLAGAIPMLWHVDKGIEEATYSARVVLIRHHALWELHPEYNGTQQAWTHWAARLLTERQLGSRMRAKYGDNSEQIMLDFRRDLTIAQAEAIWGFIALWAIPSALLYALGRALSNRQRPPPPPKPVPASASDARYRM